MNIANLYRKLKQILENSNIALVDRGLNEVDNLYQISVEIGRIGYINRLPYAITKEIIVVTEDDLKGITYISDHAFSGCDSLTSVTIPDSVTTIGYSAFASCDNLESITIPGGVTHIANTAFDHCTSLTDIYLNPTTPPTLGDRYTIPAITTIHVPIGCGDAYKSATNWSYHSSRIVEDIVA